MPGIERDPQTLNNIQKGGYVIAPCKGTPKVILMSTGSEVSLCLEAAKQFNDKNIPVQVVSLPCWEVFENQDSAYKESVLPKNVSARVAVEAGATLCWHKYVGPQGRIIGIDSYGESAPAPEIYRALGITVENIVNKINEVLSGE